MPYEYHGPHTCQSFEVAEFLNLSPDLLREPRNPVQNVGPSTATEQTADDEPAVATSPEHWELGRGQHIVDTRWMNRVIDWNALGGPKCMGLGRDDASHLTNDSNES